MADVGSTRKKLTIAVAALLALDVVAAGVLFSPLVGSETARRDQLTQLWRQLQSETREVEPLRGLDKKIPVAKKQIEDFYKTRLTSQESEISMDLGKLAEESGARIGSVKYSEKSEGLQQSERVSEIDPEQIGLKRVKVEAEFAGNYLQLAKLINGLERNKLFFLIDSVELGDAQSGVVKLQIKLETFLKTGVNAGAA
jgi:hypothetical protein